MTSGLLIGNLDLLCWWFFTDSTMVNHHFLPPFGRICLENCFPSILGKFKEMNPSLLFGAFYFELSPRNFGVSWSNLTSVVFKQMGGLSTNEIWELRSLSFYCNFLIWCGIKMKLLFTNSAEAGGSTLQHWGPKKGFLIPKIVVPPNHPF